MEGGGRSTYSDPAELVFFVLLLFFLFIPDIYQFLKSEFHFAAAKTLLSFNSSITADDKYLQPIQLAVN